MDITRFTYDLPKNLIANSPAEPRDSSRLLVLDRRHKKVTHDTFSNLADHLSGNDVLIFNNSKVFPARLFGEKETGGKIEILLLERKSADTWTAIHRGRLKENSQLQFGKLVATVLNKKEGLIEIKFNKNSEDLLTEIFRIGNTPLPPYIRSASKEHVLRDQYQTVYADKVGSAAAPTAGLHFTQHLIDKLKHLNVKTEYVTLHVGLDTFAPVKAKNIEDHQIHAEKFTLTQSTADNLNRYKKEGMRMISVGTTTTRVLETALDAQGELLAQETYSQLFIYPAYKFGFVDAMITNFHLPASTLLALVSAFVSEPNTDEQFKNFKSSMIGKAYQEAISEKYRFYSFGDAMFIT